MAMLGDHPNIVPIYEYGEEHGTPFMVMPPMTGGTVETVVKGSRDRHAVLGAVLGIASDVCKGLEFAHSKGVIHRDIKPSNVWLTDDGVAQIGDFGVAYLRTHARAADGGKMIGTVDYMAPEQAMGRDVDSRADLYSFGAMLYELIAGRKLFRGANPLAVIQEHINARPAPLTLDSQVCPRPLGTLILRMLAKDPGDRPGSATAVLALLASIRTEARTQSRISLDKTLPIGNTSGGGLKASPVTGLPHQFGDLLREVILGFDFGSLDTQGLSFSPPTRTKI
jgi:serine/threonine-protein kinase